MRPFLIEATETPAEKRYTIGLSWSSRFVSFVRHHACHHWIWGARIEVICILRRRDDYDFHCAKTDCWRNQRRINGSVKFTRRSTAQLSLEKTVCARAMHSPMIGHRRQRPCVPQKQLHEKFDRTEAVCHFPIDCRCQGSRGNSFLPRPGLRPWKVSRGTVRWPRVLLEPQTCHHFEALSSMDMTFTCLLGTDAKKKRTRGPTLDCLQFFRVFLNEGWEENSYSMEFWTPWWKEGDKFCRLKSNRGRILQGDHSVPSVADTTRDYLEFEYFYGIQYGSVQCRFNTE
jgi:hypothetical protein